MLKVGEFKKFLETLDDELEIGLMTYYDEQEDCAEYEECVEIALLPLKDDPMGAKIVLLSAVDTGLEGDELDEEEEDEQ